MEAFTNFLATNQFAALFCVVAIMVIGEVISKKSNGKLSAGLIYLILFVIGFWTILPTELADYAGLGGKVYTLSVGLLIAHLGTLISRKQMVQQWKTVVICLIGLVFLCGFVVVIGGALFGTANAVASAPVLAGGAIAAAVMRDAAAAVGNTQAGLVALVCMTLQSLIGMPVESAALRKQVRELHEQYTKGELVAEKTGDASTEKKKSEDSTYMILAKLLIVCILSSLIQTATGGAVSMYVMCLVLGFAGCTLGLIPEDALTKANSFGFLLFVLFGTLFCGFASVTPETIIPVITIVVGMFVIGTIGLAVAAFVASKIFKKDETFASAFGIVVNAYLGFPLNVLIANEAIDSQITDPEEKKVISGIITPKVLIAGFVCVTIVSVLIAGVMKSWL